MTTTTTDQGLILPTSTDADNVPTSFSSYNTGVEGRLVKRYTSTADRTTRNPTPTEGEKSYLADVNKYEWYTGTSWAPTPGQIIKWGSRTSNSTTNATATDIGVLRVDGITLIGGIGYQIWSTPLALDSTATNDEIGGRVRYDNTGANASTTSTIMPGTSLDYRQGDANVAEQRVFSTMYVPAANETLSILLCVRRIAGSGNASILGSSTSPTALYVMAMGTAPSDTGVAI